MTTCAWTVFAWPKVYASVSEFSEAVPRMLPVQSGGEALAGAHGGQSLWQGQIGGKRFGLAWEWAEAGGVPALLDPMRILSNVVLLDDDDGSIVAEDQSILFLNAAVYQLPWQSCVRLAGSRLSARAQLLAA